MAAPASIDAIEWLRKQIEESAPDPLKTMLVEMVNLLMSAEVDAICGAGYRERTSERANSRNGYRERPWDTRLVVGCTGTPRHETAKLEKADIAIRCAGRLRPATSLTGETSGCA